MATKKKTAPCALEPIDLYGNWKVEELKFPRHMKRVGLKAGASTFKIMNPTKNEGSEHVLIKKEGVGWNNDMTEIPLVEIKYKNAKRSDDELHYAAGYRLRTETHVTFEGREYAVRFTSIDNGRSLIFCVEEITCGVGDTHAGGWGTAGRGG